MGSAVLGIAREWANAFARAGGLGALQNRRAPDVGDGSIAVILDATRTRPLDLNERT